jgi:hypothetical protein
MDDIELKNTFENDCIFPDLPCKKKFGEVVVMLKNVSKGKRATW